MVILYAGPLLQCLQLDEHAWNLLELAHNLTEIEMGRRMTSMRLVNLSIILTPPQPTRSGRGPSLSGPRATVGASPEGPPEIEE